MNLIESEIRNITTNEIQSVGSGWSTLLIRGDCLEAMSELANIGLKVDMVLTDPPYQTTRLHWDLALNNADMWNCIDSLTSQNTPVLLFGAEPFSSKLRCSNITKYRYDWIWEKPQATGHLDAKKRPMRAYENICVFYDKQPTYNPIKTTGHKRKVATAHHKRNTNTGDIYGKCDNFKDYDSTERYPRNVLKFSTDKQKCNLHPTQKPVALLEYLIKTYTNEGDLVLDFTAGSFSTAIACLNTNRRFIGIELDEKYYNIGFERVKKSLIEQQSKLF